MLYPNPAETVFCLTDMQEKFLPAIPEMSDAAARIQVFLRGFHELNGTTIVTEQYPKGLGNTLSEIRSLLAPDTKVIEKSSFSSLGDPVFAAQMNRIQPKTLILAGVEAHVCILQTAMDARERGMEVYVACDAVASRKSADRDSALRMMISYGIHVLPVESILFLLIQDSKHPAFRTISKIIR